MAAPTVIVGSRMTSHQSTETRSVRDVRKDINQLEPDSYPITGIFNAAKGKLEVTDNDKYEWFEDQALPPFDLLAANLTAAAVTMTVTNYTRFRKGDLVRINQSEIVLITAAVTTVTPTIQRAWGTTAAVATAGDQLQILMNISDERATIGSIISTQKVPQYNYVFLHRTPYGASGSAESTKVYGKKDLAYEEGKAIVQHALEIERWNIMGVRVNDTTNHTRMSTPRGVLDFITTNSVPMGGTMTEAEFEEYNRRSFRFGSGTKTFYGSGKVIGVINAYGREKLQVVPSDKTYGIHFTRYLTAHGTLLLKMHKLLENESLADLTGLAGTGITIDPSDMRFRHKAGRYMMRKQVNPLGDSTMLDGTVGDILTEGGIEIAQESKHSELTGVTD